MAEPNFEAGIQLESGSSLSEEPHFVVRRAEAHRAWRRLQPP